jgi:glucosamine kinase
MTILIADSGATKCEWCLLSGKESKTMFTQGISPYFMNSSQIETVLRNELLPQLSSINPDSIFYYGTGCLAEESRKVVQVALQSVFEESSVMVTHDVMGAARALCGKEPGVCAILGTGSSSCYYDGNEIGRMSPGLGYVLGDEGSGAYLGKKVLQYYLYQTFDEELLYKFDEAYHLSKPEILDHVYRKPLANRYLAGFTMFLVANRGHYMIENIIEDGLNDFFFYQLCKFSQSWNNRVNFVGSVAFGFKDVIEELCRSYEFDLGKIIKAPMEGLIKFHSS